MQSEDCLMNNEFSVPPAYKKSVNFRSTFSHTFIRKSKVLCLLTCLPISLNVPVASGQDWVSENFVLNIGINLF